jgi:hypothetical protein
VAGAQVSYFNVTYVNERGASNSWLFRAAAPQMPGGDAVIKVCAHAARLAKRLRFLGFSLREA